MSAPAALARFVDDELIRAPLIADHAIAGALEALTKPAALEPGSSSRFLVAELGQVLAAQRPRMVAVYTGSLREQASLELCAAAPLPATPTAKPRPDARSLALVDEEAVASDVETSRTAETIKSVAEHEMRELAAFLSALAGDMQVTRDHNPLRPEAHARALWAAAQVLPAGFGYQAIFMRHAAMPLAQVLRKCYAASCTRLEDAGIQPADYRTVILPAGMRTYPADMTLHSHALHNIAQSLAVIGDRMESQSLRQPARAGAPARQAPAAAPQPRPSSPAGVAPERAAPVAAKPADPASIHGLHYTRAGATTAAAAIAPEAPTQTDARRAALLGRLFDSLLVDSRLGDDFRPAVSRLLDPVQRLSQSDANVLGRYDHPAWQFVDRIAWQAQTLPEPPQRERVRTMQVVNGLVDQIGRTQRPDAALFEWAIERLVALERNRFERRAGKYASQAAALAAAEAQLLAAPGTRTDDIGALQTVPADLFDTLSPPESEGTPGHAWLAGREPGDVARLFIQGRWVHAQLLWRGALREVWLWADCCSDDAWPIRRGALSLLHDEKLAESARPRSLLRDAAERMASQLGCNEGS